MNRPGIYQVGKVEDDGTTVHVTGWGLTQCITHCSCHRGAAGELRLDAALEADGQLGLVKYADCRCCQAWTAEELAAVVRDLADVAAMETA